MRFGLFHTVQWRKGESQRDRYRQAIAQAVHAEEIGFDTVWLTEHHFAGHALTGDTFALLAHLAALTTRIRLGTAVAVLPYHNPIKLAESATILDHLSDGRFEFGIGRGYQWMEYHALGIDMAEADERFAESIDVITRAFATDAPITHHGKYWTFEDMHLQPRPYQQPHPPIWLATTSERGFRRCVDNDWGVMIPQGRSIEQVDDFLSLYRDILAAAGRPYDPAKVLLARALYCAPDDDTAWADAEIPYRHFLEGGRRLAAPPDASSGHSNPFDTESLRQSAVFGGPDECTDYLRNINNIGIENVIFFVHLGELPHEKIIRSMDLFAQQVMPRLITDTVITEPV